MRAGAYMPLPLDLIAGWVQSLTSAHFECEWDEVRVYTLCKGSRAHAVPTLRRTS